MEISYGEIFLDLPLVERLSSVTSVNSCAGGTIWTGAGAASIGSVFMSLSGKPGRGFMIGSGGFARSITVYTLMRTKF